MGSENEILGICGMLSEGSPGMLTLGSDIEISKDGSGSDMSNAMLGRLGSCKVGKPGAVTLGISKLVSNDGSGMLTENEIDGVDGREISGKPSIEMLPKLQLTIRASRCYAG